MSLLSAIVAGLAESIRETLPHSEQTAGVWLAGFCWAFVVHWFIAIVMLGQHCATRGGC